MNEKNVTLFKKSKFKLPRLKRKFSLLLTALFLFISMFNVVETQAQGEMQIINDHHKALVKTSVLEQSDVADWAITAQHISATSQVHHIYYRQKYEGVEVHEANSSIHILQNGSVLKANDGFVSSLSDKISGPQTPGLSPLEAIKAAASAMRYPVKGNFALIESNPNENTYLFSDGQISLEDIPVKLMYVKSGNDYVLAWNLSIYELDAQNWWEMRVNATTGEMISKNNWVVTCETGSSESDVDLEDHSTHSHSLKEDAHAHAAEEEMNFMPMVGGYRVFPVPLQSPLYGARVLVNDPDDAIASPFGWHDTNGAAGPEFTVTRGNNVWAREGAGGTNPGFNPDGGAGLVFDFPYNPVWSAGDESEAAAVTNLFYWNNVIHDIMYQYGFDEASGNFQTNNYGNGGLGTDEVNALAQGGNVCNAFFGTPPDGTSGTMSMFVCGSRDGDYDNMVVIHEYAHGISNRLTGGPANSGCLGNQEQMGEGWSDYYGIVLTMPAAFGPTDSRTTGNWLFGQTAAGSGIRPFPYNTDMAVNPHTYASIGAGVSIPHGVGSVWCMMLWEMTWEIIGTVPFDPDFYNGTGGNNIAIALVTEGMKLQPCNPGFVDGRDAILAADVALFGGAYQCEIWTAFAKRGLGEFAQQGSTNSVFDGVEDFTVPAAACAVGGGACMAPTVVCPPDMTVTCDDLIVIDPLDATATPDGVCAIAGQWVTNPVISGVPGCNGTTYTYTYKAVDDEGNIGSCDQIYTIVNTPASITVPAGGNVTCFEDISISLDDATVTGGCANYNLYLVPPVVTGELGCPGATYTYTYRLIDDCGNTVEEDVVFTNGANSGPTISAPADITCECLAGVNPNPDNATVSTSCTIGSSVTVTGPQVFGPMDCPGTIYRYFYTVTDDCGRTAIDFQDFTVANGPPVFENCPEDNWLVLNCEDYGGEGGTIDVIEAWIASVTASSSCGNPLTVFNNFNPNNINTCMNNGINTVTFRATDNCGRTTFCQGTYVVVDTEAPEIIEEAQDHWEMCNYNTQANLNAWVANRGGAIASDGCSGGNISWQASPSNPQINCMGAMGTTSVTVTFIVRDNCGNKTETTATFNALMGGGDHIGQDNDQAQEDRGLALFQNRPNPFKNETLISFNLPEASRATLTIYDVNGKTLKIVEGNFNSGYNEVNVSRSELGGSGMMYFRLMTDTEAITKTMLVID